MHAFRRDSCAQKQSDEETGREFAFAVEKIEKKCTTLTAHGLGQWFRQVLSSPSHKVAFFVVFPLPSLLKVIGHVEILVPDVDVVSPEIGLNENVTSAALHWVQGPTRVFFKDH